MQSIRVAIPDDTAQKLTDLARASFRAPRQHAAALLVDAIEKAGRKQHERQDRVVDRGDRP
jgi:hypothetical protein